MCIRDSGYPVQVIAPVGSQADVPDLRIVPGLLAPTAMTLAYNDPLPVEAEALLSAAVRELAARARSGDAILNFSYDWLPLFAGDFLPCPLATLVSMGSVNRSLDAEIRRLAGREPVSYTHRDVYKRQCRGWACRSIKFCRASSRPRTPNTSSSRPCSIRRGCTAKRADYWTGPTSRVCGWTRPCTR